MKRNIILSITFLLLCTITGAQTPTAAPKKVVGKITNRNQLIQELTRRVDSLQSAYDSLYIEYQSAIEPVTSNDPEDIPLDSLIQDIEFTPENIDSLVGVYYSNSHKISENFVDSDFEELDRDTLTSLIPDSVYINRLNKMNSFIPLQFNRYVKNVIILYTDKIPYKTQEIISLAPYYLPKFEEIFDRYSMPKELKAMAVIESALNPKAVSSAKAKGMWQFIYTTGKRYGLNITSFVDERFDPIKSCEAAAKYLKDAYLTFGDWELAIASYNCGAGNVIKAIRRSGGKTDFWSIYPYLPRETRGYIPAFIAALYVLEYHDAHGITQKAVNVPAHIDTFHVNKMLHFQQVSDVIGIPMELLRELNPQYLHDIIPGTEREYVLNLPYSYTGAFADKESEIYAYKDTAFFNEVAIKKIAENEGSSGDEHRLVHKVKKGETLGRIAARYHVSVANIKKWNNLRSNTLRVGQRLALYGRATPKSSSASASSSGSSQSSSSSKTYTVKKGDTLGRIASKNGVSLSKLLKLNNMTMKSKIYPGMKIRIK